MSENNNSKNGNFWLGFFLGGLLGAFIIFVLGTKEGKKLLQKLIDRAEIYEEELEEKIVKLQERGEDLLAEAEEVKDKVVKEVAGGKRNISEKLISKIDQTLTKIEDIQRKGVAITSEVHHNYFKKDGKPLTS